MNARHTPAPWEFVPKLSPSENHRGYFIRAPKPAGHPNGPGKWALAEVQPVDEDGKEGEANARLISAAPELLEAAKEVEAWWLRDDVGQKLGGAPAGLFMLRTAIAKATGCSR